MAPKKKGKKSSSKKKANVAEVAVVNRKEEISDYVGPGHGADALLLDAIVRHDHCQIARLFSTWPGLDINRPEPNGNRPIHVAVHHQRLPIVHLLISYGADPEARNASGRTPIMQSSLMGNSDLVDLFIGTNCDLDAQDNLKCTALLLAVKTGNINIVKKLVQRGADVDKPDINGMNAWYWANVLGHQSIQDFLPRPVQAFDVWRQYEELSWFKDAITKLRAEPQAKKGKKKKGKKGK